MRKNRDIKRIIACGREDGVKLDDQIATELWELYSYQQNNKWELIRKYSDEQIRDIIQEIIRTNNSWRFS